MPAIFKNHFCRQAKEYAKFRPGYPEELFAFLAAVAPSWECAWDCATGTGQAAAGLAQHFKRVIATDASENQVANAEPHDNVTYYAATAEESGIPPDSVDLVTVAQALHWFDFEKFYDEVCRVLKCRGILAVWTYKLPTVTPEIDAVVKRFYRDIVGSYWPPERQHIDMEYDTIPFPFEPVGVPDFTMTTEWTAEHFTGYLDSWSATQRYKDSNGRNPLELISDELRKEWDGPGARTVTWPLTVKAGRHQKNS